MTDQVTRNFEDAIAILHAFSEHGEELAQREDLWWSTSSGCAPITFFVDVSDVFAWGCSDCSAFAASDIPALRQAHEDIRAASEAAGKPTYFAELYSVRLWASRERGVRIQWAMYVDIKAHLRPLFRAAADNPGYCWPETQAEEDEYFANRTR